MTDQRSLKEVLEFGDGSFPGEILSDMGFQILSHLDSLGGILEEENELICQFLGRFGRNENTMGFVRNDFWGAANVCGQNCTACKTGFQDGGGESFCEGRVDENVSLGEDLPDFWFGFLTWKFEVIKFSGVCHGFQMRFKRAWANDLGLEFEALVLDQVKGWDEVLDAFALDESANEGDLGKLVWFFGRKVFWEIKASVDDLDVFGGGDKFGDKDFDRFWDGDDGGGFFEDKSAKSVIKNPGWKWDPEWLFDKGGAMFNMNPGGCFWEKEGEKWGEKKSGLGHLEVKVLGFEVLPGFLKFWGPKFGEGKVGDDFKGWESVNGDVGIWIFWFGSWFWNLGGEDGDVKIWGGEVVWELFDKGFQATFVGLKKRAEDEEGFVGGWLGGLEHDFWKVKTRSFCQKWGGMGRWEFWGKWKPSLCEEKLGPAVSQDLGGHKGPFGQFCLEICKDDQSFFKSHISLLALSFQDRTCQKEKCFDFDRWKRGCQKIRSGGWEWGEKKPDPKSRSGCGP